MPAQHIDADHKAHIDKLTSALDHEKSKATFACVAVSSPSPMIQALTIRFGPEGSGSTVTLPTSGESTAFGKLLGVCTPASFGKGREAVHDESYRKAAKLDTDAFCSDFCPYTTGIVNIINQLLVPSVDRHRSVKAELYKLNVYSAPYGKFYGKFKPHVDTPRGDTQVGSLVVALPSAFEGGSLSVRHGDQQTVFKWAANSANAVQWAAFYSDCEHEVHEVTSGHRVTLTYNLFLTQHTSLQAGKSLALDANLLPLAGLFKQALRDARFMTDGGDIGVYLTHRYPHTNPVLSKLLPSCLKGADMAVYEVARALGLKTSLISTSKESRSSHSGGYWDDGEYEDSEGNELIPFGAYYPGLKVLEVGGCVGDGGFDEMDTTCTMFEGKFIWLNKPGYKELSRASLYHADEWKYGNEPGLDTLYTSAALLIKIPDGETRVKSGVLSRKKLNKVLMEREPEYSDEENEEEDEEGEWSDEEGEAEPDVAVADHHTGKAEHGGVVEGKVAEA
ncbi:hypothetical protein LTR27_010356 [Elasticomyces elasticus]|nr:hypothetical protein LTR27_010356 [Elasticomyces elasticus]